MTTEGNLRARIAAGEEVVAMSAAIGWSKEHIFMVEVDGRQGQLSVGMTLAELAAYMIKLGCQQAVNLDGGGSATLWVCGNVMNSPSEGQERPGANSLVLVRKKSDGSGTGKTASRVAPPPAPRPLATE